MIKLPISSTEQQMGKYDDEATTSIPERTATSLAVRLNLIANRLMMSVMLASGAGENRATSAATDRLPSLRPVGSGMNGPFVCPSTRQCMYMFHQQQIHHHGIVFFFVVNKNINASSCSDARTSLMESRAASASVSAQETTPGQAASSLALMASTTSYPRTPRFSGASFSAVLPGRGGVEQDGALAAAHEAVEGEEPEHGGRQVRRLGHHGRHLLQHHVLRLRASLVVRAHHQHLALCRRHRYRTD